MSIKQRGKSTVEPASLRGKPERRRVCRYAVVQDKAWLGWWEGESFQSTAATIVDISLRGAYLTVDRHPPKDQPIWFCPPGITTNDQWLETRMIDARKKFLGPREVRLSFRLLFPYEIFKAVVYGPDSFTTPRPAVLTAEDSEDRDWW
jgi:hypothetical protein